jgi:putative pyruvate formate lyase activating enzyme
MKGIEPGYIDLYRSGELKRRAGALEERLSACDICPRECGVNRLAGERGFCHSGILPIVASVGAHHGEEPVLSGRRGSGTIFFGNCNLRCAYCQNYQISQDYRAQRRNEVETGVLAERMLFLQDELGCHNINLVSPSHLVPQIVRAVLEAVSLGPKLPLVYNTSSYDAVATLRELDGIISIYLADLRYASNKWGRRFSRAPDYVERSRAAIKEMYRQVGNLIVDEANIAQKGLIVRHLILPNGIAGSRESLGWLVGEVSPQVALSLMAQYFPAHRAPLIPLLSRTITSKEYDEVVALVEELGIENGWLQGMGASKHYRPDFSNENAPFSAEEVK